VTVEYGSLVVTGDGRGEPPVLPTDPRVIQAVRDFGLEGRTLYLPHMPYGGTYLLAAAIRSIGFDCWPTNHSDARSMALGGTVTSGEECYPQKITIGDFLRMIDDVGRDRVAFLMPEANGPCRFGQYRHLIRRTLDDLGYSDVPVITITSNDGYASIGQYSRALIRTAWRAVLASDALMKMLLRTRPYELEPGATDQVYLGALRDVGRALALREVSDRARLDATVAALTAARDRFRAVPARFDRSRPLIGVVGEIFCRLNQFANADVVRLVEEQGGECWLAGIGEWVWYTDDEQRRRLSDEGRRLSRENVVRGIKATIMKRDEHALLGPFADDFVGYEEEHSVGAILERAWPYLPYDGALGEMVISTGTTIYLHGKGADGIIDISPFTCMNGIVTEAIYPAVSRDLDGLPIRTFYFDGTQSDMERDIGIFLELARTYQRRKKPVRRYPACFPPAAAG
jgi:predicted nucleotide-binding protein (sugar kinase/HSP70/actin superfamily)